ncbi:MAG: hypothetical protein K2X31_12025 [Sphingopyxis sp.]|nr:hypothetical protein [Sphingopyxis sp.]
MGLTLTFGVALLLSGAAAPDAGRDTPTAPAPAAEPAEQPAVGEDIIVTGMGSGGYRLTADQLRDAVRAFNRNRDEFAPEARLQWQVRPASAAEGLDIWLVHQNGERVELELDAQGRFALPNDRIAEENGWRLQTNAGRRQIRIRPETFSPGSSEARWRMGDARLLCRVFWAFAENDFSLFERAAFGALGGCGSRRVRIWFSSENPVASAASGTAEFSVREDGTAWQPPLHDPAISNEAIVTLTYR